MVFLNNDFYTASGSVKLFNYWTDKVTKFDTSSFYNWEQDNLPIYDLEERTYHLWEQLGHPTSSLPGIVLVVSGGAPTEYYELNRNTFKTVSAAIAALPQILNYPVIIEICNKGNLGSVDLKNIKCGPRGSLEIVNKVFAKQEPEFNGSSLNSVGKISGPYYLLSSISSVDPSLTYTVSFSARKHFQNSKSEFLNESIFSDTSLTSINNSLFGFISPIYENRNVRSTYFISSTLPTNSNLHAITVDPFETSVEATNHSINEYDFSGVDIVTNTDFITTGNAEVDSGSKDIGLFYGNKFEKVLITNSDGPIYLRNFFVDGDNMTTKNSYGIEVTNSRNIFLENCVCARHTKAGFYFNNSKVIITRGMGAYRNYATTNSISPSRISMSGVTETNIDIDTAAGLYALNSEIQFSSTAQFERSKFENDPVFSSVSSFGSLSYGLNYPLNFSRNSNGIILENSKLYGGILGGSGTILVSELNSICGFKLFNSVIEWDGRLKARQNNIGLLAVNSDIKLDRSTFREHTLNAINLVNSNLTYNKNSIAYNGAEAQYSFNHNGKHLNLINSNYGFNKVNGIPNYVGIHKFENCNTKSIRVLDSSKCVLLHSFIRSRNSLEDSVKYGDPISVENNSRLVLKGTKENATTIIGRETAENQRRSSGIYASNNSIVDIQGPTVLAQHAVNVLVDSNSVLNVTPHRDSVNKKLEITEFNLNDDANHTMVELHSTRACLVADKNSIINMEDLGDYQTDWARGAKGTEALTFSPDYTNSETIRSYIKGGFIQFYPNPDTNHNGATTYGSLTSFYPVDIDGVSSYSYLLNRETESFNEYSAITYGGMCVRALNNSLVNVRNVHFPAGFWNPSSLYYHFNTAPNDIAKLCSLLFIWNIADDSQLHASYCSVSSMFPADVGYHGPPAIWLTGLNEYGIFSGTPLAADPGWNTDAYVSSYCLLDYFGSGPAAASGIFSTSPANQGVFRLYFSVDPAVNSLAISNTTSLAGAYFSGGWIPQVFSQGYYPAVSLSASPIVSGLHKTLLRYTFPLSQVTERYNTLSGLYSPVGYGGEVRSFGPAFYANVLGAGLMHNPLSTRVFVDESAANTFSNAKHCATGKSGAPKVVSIYYPYTSSKGEANYNNKEVGRGVGSVNFFDLSRNN